MYLTIFFLDYFEKCETKCSRIRKSTRPVEHFFKPYCSKNPKSSYENITIVDMSKYHQTKNGVTKSKGLLFYIRALKVQICKSYFFMKNMCHFLKSIIFCFLSTIPYVFQGLSSLQYFN